jgi:ribosomal protein S18 acetylase RimI-like enzyme
MSSDTFLDGFKVRCIEPRDLPVVKELHEEFFPVRYQDEFYDSAVQGVGMRGMALYSRIIITDDASEKIVGFVLAQFLDSEFCDERSLFYGSANAAPNQLFYILTLGVRREYRNRGIATALIEGCSEYASANLECGLVRILLISMFFIYATLFTRLTICIYTKVYLHVITYNDSAIRLYKSCDFQHLRTLIGTPKQLDILIFLDNLNNFFPYRSDFYNIDNKPYDSYLYGKYVNNYSGDVIESFATMIRYLKSSKCLFFL